MFLKVYNVEPPHPELELARIHLDRAPFPGTFTRVEGDLAGRATEWH
jgi:hypothetical protein